jgi:hypothetical protein
MAGPEGRKTVARGVSRGKDSGLLSASPGGATEVIPGRSAWSSAPPGLGEILIDFVSHG